MTDDVVWSRAEIESPCKKICLMHPQADLCMGCFRTRYEIAGWSRMTPDQRRTVMDELPDRESETQPKRRGGRDGRRQRQ
jgi:predicted Fe-S protein YdhL (DUF1289 family)